MTWLLGIAWRSVLFGSKWKLWLWGIAGAFVLVKTYGVGQQRKGAEKERVRVETKAKKDVSKAVTAGSKSADPRARGVLDPNTRD